MNPVRTKPHRYRLWNYGNAGVYFVTICTKERICYFGKIENAQMILSHAGEQATIFISEIPAIFPQAAIDTFQVMPDHIHLLIRIRKDAGNRLKPLPVYTKGIQIQKDKTRKRGIHPLEKGSLASVVNHFKGKMTKWCKNNGYPNFQWVTGYYDEIIFSDVHYYMVDEYIRNNPANWGTIKEM